MTAAIAEILPRFTSTSPRGFFLPLPPTIRLRPLSQCLSVVHLVHLLEVHPAGAHSIHHENTQQNASIRGHLSHPPYPRRHLHHASGLEDRQGVWAQIWRHTQLDVAKPFSDIYNLSDISGRREACMQYGASSILAYIVAARDKREAHAEDIWSSMQPQAGQHCNEQGITLDACIEEAIATLVRSSI